MIFDTLENAWRYDGLGNNLSTALKYLQENDLSVLPVGRIEINGDDLFALVQEYASKPDEQGIWESHRNYIDIQYLVSGQERMVCANLDTMQLGEYFPNRDFQAMTGTGFHVNMFAGSFFIFFPEDAHMPGLHSIIPGQVRKVVLKVKIEGNY